jgi:hypothetical protein
MARRDHDFSASQRESIIAYHNFTCAACGADDSLHADHWISGDASDEGVCLCANCNVVVKGAKYIPELYRLPVRGALNVVTHAEYKAQVAANRKAFASWANQFRYTKKGNSYNWKNIKNFVAPF